MIIHCKDYCLIYIVICYRVDAARSSWGGRHDHAYFPGTVSIKVAFFIREDMNDFFFSSHESIFVAFIELLLKNEAREFPKNRKENEKETLQRSCDISFEHFHVD